MNPQECAHIMRIAKWATTGNANPNEVKMSVALIVFIIGGGIGTTTAAVYLFTSLQA